MTDRAPRTVLLVDDHVLLVESLAMALDQRSDVRVRTSASTAPAAVLREVADDPPDLVLLDLDLGEHGSAEPLVERLTDRGVRVLMLTASRDPLRHAACLEAGAVGVVRKDVPFRQLVDAVERVARGGPAPGTDHHGELLAALRAHRRAEDERLAPFRALTPREREVLAGLLAGRTVKELAAEAVVSPTTVRSQVRAVLTKLGVRTQGAAVARAREAGWVPPGDG